MKKIIILTSLLISSSLFATDYQCQTVKKGDVLTKYYQAVSSGDGQAMLSIFSPFGYAHGHMEKGKYTNNSPKQQVKVVNFLKTLSANEQETCRISTEDLGDFTMIKSRYQLSISVKGKTNIMTGTKMVTVENSSNTIVSMNFENDK